jgi:hypothetical protein
MEFSQALIPVAGTLQIGLTAQGRVLPCLFLLVYNSTISRTCCVRPVSAIAKNHTPPLTHPLPGTLTPEELYPQLIQTVFCISLSAASPALIGRSCHTLDCDPSFCFHNSRASASLPQRIWSHSFTSL